MDNQNHGIGVVERKDFTDTGKGWNSKTTSYVLDISKKCIIYRNIHEQTAISFERKQKCFSLFLIFLSFSTTIYSFFTTEENINSIFLYSFFLKFLNVLVSTFVTVNNFLEYQQLSSKHRMGSQQFLDLNKSISEELLTDTCDRIDCIRFIKWVGNSFTQIRKGLPYPPHNIILLYDKSQDLEKGLNISDTALKDFKDIEISSLVYDNESNICNELEITNENNSKNQVNSQQNQVNSQQNQLQNYELQRIKFVT